MCSRLGGRRTAILLDQLSVNIGDPRTSGCSSTDVHIFGDFDDQL